MEMMRGIETMRGMEVMRGRGEMMRGMRCKG